MLNKKILGILCCVPLLIASCQSGTLQYTFHSFSDETWSRADTVVIPFDSLHAGDYALDVCLRIGNDYEYRSLWMVVETVCSGSKTAQRDTLEIALADEDGDLLGGGLNIKQVTQECPPIHIGRHTDGTLRLFHIMRKRDVAGIHDIGIKISR